MDQVFGWKPAYSVHVAAIDAQHRKLIRLLDELQRALQAGQAFTITDRIFRELVAYTDYHFKMEERLMQQHEYPGMAEHKFEHEVLTRRVLLFKQSYDQGKVALIPMSLLLFLQDWLRQHILETDKKYGEFLNAKGVK